MKGGDEMSIILVAFILFAFMVIFPALEIILKAFYNARRKWNLKKRKSSY